MGFQPDYHNIADAAVNKKPARIPLYEHIISDEVIEKVIREDVTGLLAKGTAGKRDYFKRYTRFFREMGYDTVSFEQCITKILPGGGALYSHADPVIKTKEDIESYPWGGLPDLYFNEFDGDFSMLAEEMPEGMRAIGGPGNGLFEIAQDLCGYELLCYMAADDPGLYREVFSRVAGLMLEIWRRFLDKHADTYCVCRFGDDLGFRSQTLLPAADIREILIPHYQRLVAQVHEYGKPFLLHSCGAIFDVMDELIGVAGINAKHSNEDAIAPFSTWVGRYGSKIGNFGGIDTDVLCSRTVAEIEKYVTAVFEENAAKDGGIAFGSGNSIPDYVPVEGYVAMVNTVRNLRRERV
ncbi:hypothetical protein LJC56_01025 [Christensenellaceae bacterium OttesenSCG-928-K19]|nr:hypothetical protein [Christensenellaceae bacterium OttesenSCG-928-K19]